MMAPRRRSILPVRSDEVALWNRAAGKQFPLLSPLWGELTIDDPSFSQDGLLLERTHGQLAGFAVAKRFTGSTIGAETFAEVGYVPLLAVHPDHQGRGLASRLLERAEAYLGDAGARRIVLGGSFFHAFPGIPADLAPARAFFAGAGYSLNKTVWDVQRDARTFEVPPAASAALQAAKLDAAMVRAERAMSYDPVRTAALLEFVAAEFGGRWLYDLAHAFGRIDDPAACLTLFDGPRAIAFAQVHWPRSSGTLRWQGFDPDIGAVGPIGVAKAYRGHHLGLAV
ncbi:MAG: GNAT family N-acetyltransferase, partial [Cyanobacteria bacterium REEB65]|nr:GNAT family N-acetyltransferase [Cyanobacteria bacterium REEB65]